MRVIVHVNQYYDWLPVPADVKVSARDIKARRVIPANDSTPEKPTWAMRVNKVADTHTEVHIPEQQLIAVIIANMCRGTKRPLTRSEAVANYLASHVMGDHAHETWMEDFEVHDEGADEALLRAEIALHVEAGNIDELSVDALVDAYTTPLTADHHVKHMHGHFGLKAEAVAAHRRKRAAQAAEKGHAK